MAEQTSGSQTEPSTPMAPSPGGRPMGAAGITLITLYLTLVTIVVFHCLVVLWPPNQKKVGSSQTAAEQSGKEEKGAGAKTGSAGSRTTPGAQGTSGNDGSEKTTEPSGSGLTTAAPDGLVSDSFPITTAAPDGLVSDSFPITTAAPDGLVSDSTPRGTDTDGDSGRGQSQGDVSPKEAPLSCPDKNETPTTLFRRFHPCLSEEERLFLIVMFAGALGGLVHTLRSFFWYAGNRKLVLSWTGFYITQPILGATLATVFYLVVRGGFFSPQSEISDTSPFGFAALAALIGMFTDQAAEKLKQIAENLFATAPKGADHAGPPTVASLSRNTGLQAGGETVTITGSGFMQNATVTFGGQAAKNVQVASGGTSLTAVTPAGTGTVTVEVTNPDGQKGSLANAFTYQ